MATNVSIVVVNYNGWDDTRQCLRSLNPLGASVILVDNASREDRCGEFQREFPDCHYVRNRVNGGWAGGNNAGVRIAIEQGAEWLLLLNNDTVVAPRLIDSLLSVARMHPDYGIIGPVICWMDEPTRVMTDGCAFNHAHGEGFFQRQPVPLSNGSLAEVEIVNGCAMMVAARVFRKIGMIDERFFLVHEESDFCLRARAAGFRCGVLGEALVWHKGSSSFARTGKRLQRYYDARNLFLLLCKHRRHPDGRRWFASLGTYFRYVYHRYCVERENGDIEAANAVIDGMSDAFGRRFGPMASRPRLSSRLLRGTAETLRRLKRTIVG